jgi:phosphotransferase system enzyme I (PtsI)
MLLLGMGLRLLSATPHNIPEVKKLIRSITLEEANEVASQALAMESASEISNFLRNQTQRVLPELWDNE